MKRVILALTVMIALPLLAACGFTPLYARPGLSAGLSSIETIAPQGRLGALIRESLDDALAVDRSKPMIYRLDLHLRDERIPRGIRPDGTASRFELILSADWKLVNKADSSIVVQGTSRAETTFDRAEQPYSAISAQEDAEERVAAELARRIQLDLASWMASKR